MKKLFIIAAALCLTPLSACASLSTVPTSPGEVANLTKADEQAAKTAELGYKLWRQSITVGVASGLIKGQLAATIRQLDLQLYSALTAVERAYEAANATEFRAAIANFNAALEAGHKALPGGGE